ncbi:MAG: hypothetical protein HAW61_02885, partial [Candidatus Portiera sp.]|nr:hypothetical protein [Portiera sp.]
SIYSSWGDGWCGVDPTTGGVFYNFNASDPREDLRQDEYRGWNLGVAKDYPALSCLPVSLEEQRSFDFDGDDLRGDADNCPLVASSDTTDTDGDGAGNPCDNDDDGDGVTDDQDLAPLDENIGALQEYQLADFTASAMTDKALLRWTNPTNLTGTSLTSINLTIRSYSAATGENGLVETTTMTLIDGNLTSGPQSLNLTLATGRYYDFSLTPVFSADNHRGVTVTTSPRILVPIDSDGDGVADSDDMDADGDGLIDIYMATDFDNIRNNLVSTGLSSITGCGDRASITECRGYELMNNISLSSYANWDPIGTGLNKFEAIFEGNNNSINNLKITSASSDSVGLFAGFAGSTQVRNLVLSNISIEVTQNLVGGLVGEISNATITNVHLNKVNITGGENVGGLAGSMDNGVIIDTSVQGEDIVATTGNVGGLLGHSYAGELNNSWVIWREITTPGANAGGIIGLHQSDGFELSVNATYAQANLIEGNMNVGGLIGNGNITLERLNYLHIESSYAHIKTLKAVTKNSGGLVGRNFGNRSVSIKYSYSIIENLDNPQLDSAAGLAFHPLNTDIEDSYWDASTNFTQGDPFASGIDRVDERVLGNRTTSELQSGQPSDGGIYSSWDPLFWDFGTNNEYPVLSNLVGNFVKQQKRSAFTE